MIWKHYYSLLASTAVIVALIITRPDFEDWYLVPPLLAGGGGSIVIRLGGQKRRQSKMLDAIDDEIEAKRRLWKFEREVESRQMRSIFLLLGAVLFIISLPFLALWLLPLDPIDTIERLLGLFGCSC